MDAVTRVPGSGVDPDAETEGPVEPHGSEGDGAPEIALGRYLVIESIGHGGMGIVMRAYDPKLQREVALKLLRTRDKAARARMVREARAMARLNHPNVVAVYDVEPTDDGGVAVAMELVRGQTLGDWMRERPQWRAVIDRFVAAGRGLCAAHDAGLLHRDFKPSNVLIGLDGRVRVTDFGLARLDGLPSTNETSPETPEPHASDVAAEPLDRGTDPFATRPLVTETGVVLGTPPYMAPEQHVPGQLSVAADQYAFCVALWEALAHRLPFVGKGDRLLAAKREGPPPWPDHVRVPRRIVDAIARGLAFDAAARWPSMHALLAALVADGVSLRRRGLAVAAVAMVAGVAAIGLMAPNEERELCRGAAARLADAWSPADRETIERALTAGAAPHLVDLAPRLLAEIDDYAQTWQAVHTDACEATRIRGEQSEALLDRRMACLDRAKLRLGAAIDLLAEGELDVLRNAHEVVGGLPELAHCSDADALSADVAPPDPSEAEAVEGVREELARVEALRDAARYDAALALVEHARSSSEGLTYAPLVAELALERAVIHEGRAKWAEAKTAYLEVLRAGSAHDQWHEVGAALRQLGRLVAMHEARHAEALGYLEMARGFAERTADPLDDAAFHSTLGIVLREQGKIGEAEAEHRTALAIRERVLGPRHVEVAQSLTNLAATLAAAGELAESATLLRRALEIQTELWGPSHPSVARVRHGLGTIHHDLGDDTKAEEEFRAAIAIKTAALGPDHPDVATSVTNLGLTLAARGEYAAAREQYALAIRILVAVNGTDHPDVAAVRINLAGIMVALGDTVGAERECGEALAILERTYGAAHPQVAATRLNYASLLDDLGRTEEAIEQTRAAALALETALGKDHANVASAHQNLGAYEEARGHPREAEASYRRALTIRELALGTDHPAVAETLAAMVDVVMARGGRDEARELLERAWVIRRDHDTPPKDRANTAFALARVLWSDRDERERARELATRAREEYGRAEDVDATDRAAIDAWLASHR